MAARNDKATNNGPSYRLTEQDAVEVWIRHWSGEYQNRIAAHFHVNPGRVNEIIKGHKFPGSEQLADRMI